VPFPMGRASRRFLYRSSRARFPRVVVVVVVDVASSRDARVRAFVVLGSFARARARFGSRGRVTTGTARGSVVHPRRRRAFAPESTRTGCWRRALASERRRTTTTMMKRELVC
jgi:hypothetical protein